MNILNTTNFNNNYKTKPNFQSKIEIDSNSANKLKNLFQKDDFLKKEILTQMKQLERNGENDIVEISYSEKPRSKYSQTWVEKIMGLRVIKNENNTKRISETQFDAPSHIETKHILSEDAMESNLVFDKDGNLYDTEDIDIVEETTVPINLNKLYQNAKTKMYPVYQNLKNFTDFCKE